MSAVDIARKTLTDRFRNIRYENPVVTKELRSRMRGSKAHQIMLGYVLLTGVILLGIYYSEWVSMSGAVDVQRWLDIRLGSKMFSVLTWVQAILIGLIAPALTSGCITIEKEQQTIEMLSLTTLSARNIIVGKLMSGYLFVLMLLGCSLPLAGMCMMFGSISPGEIIVTYMMLAAWGFLFSSIGVFYSSLFKKTAGASLAVFFTVAIYGITTTAYALVSNDPYSYYHSDWSNVFGGLSGCTALDNSLVMSPVFHMKLPAALVGIVFNTAIGILLAVIATTRLPYHKVERAGLIRIMILAMTLSVLFLFIGNILSGPIAPGSGRYEQEFVTTVFVILLIIFLPATPIFSTGPIGRGVNPIKSLMQGSLFKKAFENRPAGGSFFLVLWWILGSAVMMGTFAYANTYSPGGGTGHYGFDLAAIFQASIGVLGAIIAWSVIGIFFSSIFPNRNSAIVMVILAIVLAWAIYPMMIWQHESNYNYTWENESGAIWQFAYLWPWTSVNEITGGINRGIDGPLLWLDKSLTGVGCLGAWAVVAVIVMLLAGKYYKNGRGIPDE